MKAAPSATGLIAALSLAWLSGQAGAVGENDRVQPRRGLPPETVARVIVALKAESSTFRRQILSSQHAAETVAQVAQQRADSLAARAGVALTAGRMVGTRAQVVKAAAGSGLDSATLAARLAAHPDVEYAVPDRRVRATAIPNDPLYLNGPASGNGPAVGQWYLRAPDAAVRSAVNAQGAWDYVTGASTVVVAVLDTGVLANHPDLAGRVLAGYDLIEDAATANDGNGRDADATDAGDWITTAENTRRGGPFEGCGADDSSWHGTQVSGIIGAAANNGIGMAGTAHGVSILPVRVLGKCGGYDSDIVAGIYWAAGIDQPGLPGSATPARVLNLSLGGDGACSPAYRDAVAEVGAQRQAVLVAAAGNSTGHPVSSPANCPGVIGVTGLRHVGTKVGFSDIGPEVTIAAPGGNCINTAVGSPCLYPILTTANSGTRAALANGHIWTDGVNPSVGTSFATPIVAGTVALMLSARPALTPAKIIETLRATARAFPTSGADNGPDDPTPVQQCRTPDAEVDQLQCYCTSVLCGAGMLDTAAAVLSAVQNVSPQELARQLLDFGESRYPQYFPGHPATLASEPFLYRFYPATGAYLGVVVNSDPGYLLNGVYVMGGPFGNAPLFVGRVTDFIAIVPSTAQRVGAGSTAR